MVCAQIQIGSSDDPEDPIFDLWILVALAIAIIIFVVMVV